MAIFNPGVAIGQISGRIAGSVFSRNRGGAYIRNGAIPSASNTDRALEVKGIMGVVSQAWANLTANERAAWFRFAQSHPVTNRLGRSITLTGNNWFTKCNTILLGVAEDQILLPPTAPAPSGVVIEDFAVTVTAPTLDPSVFTVTVGDGALPAGYVYEVFACVVNSPSINYVRNLFTRIAVSAEEAGPALELLTEAESVLGSLQVGNVYHVQVRLVDIATGLVSARTTAKVTAIASDLT